MKKLIIIQNDYPGTGKSTLSLCLQRYLAQYGVDHRLLCLSEGNDSSAPGATLLDADSLTPRSFLAHVDACALTILEVGTGLGEYFNQFLQSSELDTILRELEGSDVDVDRLADRVARAADLIALCRDRIGSARLRIDEVIADLDGPGGRGDAGATESP